VICIEVNTLRDFESFLNVRISDIVAITKSIKPSSILLRLLPESNRLERIWKIAQVDFQSRYYNDRLGLLWALIKPIFEATVYFVAFKYLLGVEKENFGLFLFAGIVTWSAFAEGSSRSIGLLKAKSYLIENVQFEHIDLYFSHVGSVFFGFLFNFSALTIIALIFGQSLTFQFLLVTPIVVFTLFLITMAFSMLLSTLQPFLKDITHFWDMAILAGLWVSAVFFEAEVVLDKFPLFAKANPFIGIISNIRGVVIDAYDVSYYWLGINLIYAVVLSFVCYLIFKRFSGLALEKL